MNKILIVIDAQNDFISGALGNPACEPVVEKIIKIIEKANEDKDTLTVATYDTHGEDYLDTLEGKLLPVPHCIKGTKGWQLEERIYNALGCPDLVARTGPWDMSKVALNIEKNTFGYLGAKYGFKRLDTGEDLINKDTTIILVGFDTDICVISNALILRAMYPNNKIQVIADACWGTTKEKHKAALDVMESCQIEVINRN